MKKFFALTAMLVLLTGTSAFAAISGSGHDFTSQVPAWTNEICAPCHTPHNAISGAGPLWSHTNSGATFVMYTSATINMTIAGSPQSESLACLSCHDGETNMDDFIGSASTGTVMSAVGPTLGNDLRDDHPISLTYDPTQEPGGYVALATVQGSNLVLFGGATDQVECATCHDVHNGTAFTSMLRVDPDASAICLTCHIK